MWEFIKTHARLVFLMVISLMLCMIDVIEGTTTHVAYGIGVLFVGFIDALGEL